MKRRLLLFLVMLAAANPAMAQVIVRTIAKPDSGIVLGQPVRVLIDVLFPDGMPRPPRVSLPEVPGAQVMRTESQATTMSERIDGKDHVGQRFEFMLYPRRGGRLVIPAPRISLLDANGDEVGRLQGQPLAIDIAVPAGVDLAQPLLATTTLTLTERWSPAPATPFKPGDALVRTIVREAANVPAMAMLDLAFIAPPGVRLYVDPPQSEDRIERGDLTGRRIDRVTYVFERGGSFTIDPLAQPWWDLDRHRLHRAEAQGATIAVMAMAPSASTPDLRLALWFIPVMAVLGAILWACRPVRALLRQRRARWLASEEKAFADLRAACRRDDVRLVYHRFTIWRTRIEADDTIVRCAVEIEAALFATASWSRERSQDFETRLAAWRTPARSIHSFALPALNPGSPL